MKSRDNLLRLKHFQVEDKTRQLAQIDMMIAEFEKMHGDLQAQIEVEEEKAGITDPTHFAYPTFAKAARDRQENLDGSIRDLKDKRVNAEAALGGAIVDEYSVPNPILSTVVIACAAIGIPSDPYAICEREELATLSSVNHDNTSRGVLMTTNIIVLHKLVNFRV